MAPAPDKKIHLRLPGARDVLTIGVDASTSWYALLPDEQTVEVTLKPANEAQQEPGAPTCPSPR